MTPDTPYASAQPDTARVAGVVDDAIDLRQIITVPFVWWKEIALLTVLMLLLAVGGLYALRTLTAPAYQATADVAIAGTVSAVTFDDRFTTSGDEAPSNAAARRTSLLGLAESPSLAVAVIDELGNQLSVPERAPARLANQVNAELQVNPNRPGESDLVRITATADSPLKAEQIANAWARAYVHSVNQIYGQVPDDMLVSLSEQEQAAQREYQAAQAQFEQTIAQSRYDELTRLIELKAGQVEALQAGQLDVLTGLVRQTTAANEKVAQAVLDADARNRIDPYVTQQQLERTQRLDYIHALYGNQSAVFQQQVRSDLMLLEGYHTQSVRAVLTRDAALALRSQVAAASGAGGSALAADVLQLQAYTDLMNVTAPPAAQAEPATAEAQATAPKRPANPDITQPGTQLAVDVSSASPQVVLQVADSPLQVQLGLRASATKEEILSELDALVEAMSARIQDLDVAIAATNTRLLSGTQYTNLGQRVPSESPLGQLASTVALSTTAPADDVTGAASVLPAVAPSASTLVPLLSALEGDTAVTMQVATLEAEIRSQRAQLELQGALVKEATDRRDIAWKSYQAMKSKLAELALARAASNTVVRFAAAAVEPVEAAQTLSMPLAVAFALVAGVLGGILLAFVLDMLGKRPFLSRYATPGAVTVSQ